MAPRRAPPWRGRGCASWVGPAAAAASAACVVARGPAALVLLGPSGSGKSETGNTLVGEEAFKVSGGLESETLFPSAREVDFDGRRWQVVDTPGYFDTSRSPEELAAALERFSEVVSDHIVALAFVVPYGRFSDAHLRGWRLIRGAFGDAALKHVAIVFTSCGSRTEDDVLDELGQLCMRSPQSLLCSVLSDLEGDVAGGNGTDRIVTFGALEPDRRERDRARLFELAAALETAAGGRGYDHGEFLRVQARRRLTVQRIAAVPSEEDRRVLQLLLANVKAGAASDGDLQRRLQQAEGLDPGAVRTVVLDFEDRTLGPLQQVGTAWRQPMPIPYISMREYSADAAAGPSGGELFVHTGTDSGVRLRHGDQRTGELRSAPFVLGPGRVAWQSAGAGGFIAICPADAGEDFSGCLERRFSRRSAAMAADEIAAADLGGFVGSMVFLRVVDDQTRGWGFIALDNLEYPVYDVDGGNATTTDAPTLTTSTTSTTRTKTSTTTAETANDTLALSSGGVVGSS